MPFKNEFETGLIPLDLEPVCSSPLPPPIGEVLGNNCLEAGLFCNFWDCFGCIIELDPGDIELISEVAF